jgi:hypothetical protein
VLRTVRVMHRLHGAFKAFDDPDRDLTRFVELRIFLMCVHLLVPWLRDMEPCLT